MSEPDPGYMFGAKRYHQLPVRTPEQINAAYHEALTSPAGQIVMDDLYRLVCFSRRPVAEEYMEAGMKALWLYVLGCLSAHEERGRASENELPL